VTYIFRRRKGQAIYVLLHDQRENNYSINTTRLFVNLRRNIAINFIALVWLTRLCASWQTSCLPPCVESS